MHHALLVRVGETERDIARDVEDRRHRHRLVLALAQGSAENELLGQVVNAIVLTDVLFRHPGSGGFSLAVGDGLHENGR